MTLNDVKPGQRFMLMRNRKRYTHMGQHPTQSYRVLVEKYDRDQPWRSLSLHRCCKVKLVIREGEA